MATVYQNDLKIDIRNIACYFMSIANARHNHEWTADELNNIFDICKQNGSIDKDNCIIRPQQVANTLYADLRFIDKKYSDYVPLPNDYIIGCWKKTPDSTSAHFVVMDNSGIYTKEHVLWDPWRGGSLTVKKGVCTSIRVYRRIG